MKPILFSTPMVQAILAGRKSQTRRVIKPQPDCPYIGFDSWRDSPKNSDMLGEIHKIPYCIGENLWVRETWFVDECKPDCAGRTDDNECPFNRVNDKCYGYKTQYNGTPRLKIKWCPSIFMPREAARIFLRVTDVGVERVQDITVEDVMAEGLPADNEIRNPDPATHEGIINWNHAYAQHLYHELWDSLNSKRGYGWNLNPFVWVITFERVERPDGDTP